MNNLNEHWILEDKKPKAVDLMTWAEWFEKSVRTPGKNPGWSRIVQQTMVWDTMVSTVFLGLNHQFGDGPPLLFETMIFGPADQEREHQWRYSTWEQAEEGHKKAMALVQAYYDQPGFAIRGFINKCKALWKAYF